MSLFTDVYMRSVLSQSGKLDSFSRFETKYLNVLILNLSLELRKFQLDFVSNSNNIYFSSSCHISGGVSYLEYAENLPRRKASPFLSSDCEFGLAYPIRNSKISNSLQLHLNFLP